MYLAEQLCSPHADRSNEDIEQEYQRPLGYGSLRKQEFGDR